MATRKVQETLDHKSVINKTHTQIMIDVITITIPIKARSENTTDRPTDDDPFVRCLGAMYSHVRRIGEPERALGHEARDG